MLCYRCGSHVPDGGNKCPVCGHVFSESGRPAAANNEKGRGPGPLKEGQTFADRYIIKDLLTIGSIGWLYRGRDQDMDLDVILKIIAPNLLQTPEEQNNFAVAAKNARRVRHPNIIRIFDSGHEEGLSYYSMPFTQGLTLEKIIALRQENNEHFTMAELYGLFAQIASAIDALTGYGPICTLKPSNIIVMPDLLKVTGVPDFIGLPHFPYVAMQRKKGTLGYMAPAAQKEGQVLDVRADIYSMAIILGEMLTGFRASEKPEQFAQALDNFPGHVRQAFRFALLQESESYPYQGAFDFVTAVFPEEVAQESLQLDTPSAHDDDTLKNLEGDTVLELTPEEAALSEDTICDNTIDEATVMDMPSLPTIHQDEELELSAEECEEEEPPPPPAPAMPSATAAPVVVAAASLMTKAEPVATVADVEMPADPVNETMPTFGGIPEHLRVKPIAESKPRDTLLVERPVKEKKKGHGGLYAFLVILLLGAGISGAFWYMNQQQQQQLAANVTTDSVSDGMSGEVVAERSPLKDMAVAKTEEAAANSKKVDKEHGRYNRENRGRAERDSLKDSSVESKGAVKVETSADSKKAEADESSRAVKAAPADKKEAAVVVVKEEAVKEREPVAVTAASREGPKEEPKLPPDNRAKEEIAKKVAAASIPMPVESPAAEEKGSCPADMIYIPAGTFQMGTADSDSMQGFDDKKLSAKHVKGFCIDKYEFPNVEGKKPVQALSYNQAVKMCQNKGKRLCKEEEWEKACKGPNNYRFPYGNRNSNTQCNTGAGGVVASGQFARCKSPYGVYDMAGNVAEWTNNKLDLDFPDRIYKGGSYGGKIEDTRCSARHGADPNSAPQNMGVRCCKNQI